MKGIAKYSSARQPSPSRPPLDPPDSEPGFDEFCECRDWVTLIVEGKKLDAFAEDLEAVFGNGPSTVESLLDQALLPMGKDEQRSWIERACVHLRALLHFRRAMDESSKLAFKNVEQQAKDYARDAEAAAAGERWEARFSQGDYLF